MTFGEHTGFFTVAGKELTQLANRGRFHIEKGFFVLAAAGAFIVAAAASIEGRVSPEEMADFGREVFYTVNIGACLMLSAFALLSSSGIIMSERTGRRLEILRITPLSLRMIVLGKGLAIAVKSVLVLALLAPVLAATQFYGGVSFGDLSKAVTIIVADVIACTGIGLFVSAGARTNLDRVVRGGEIVIIWLVFTAFCLAVSSAVGWSSLAAVSPIGVWDGLWGGRASWAGVSMGAAANLLVGLGLAALSVPVVKKAGANEERAPAEPKLKDFAGGLERISSARRRIRRETAGRLWVGGLLGNEIKQSSMFLVLLPLAVCIPPLVVLGLDRLFGVPEDIDSVMVVAAWTSIVTVLALAVQSGGAVARDKQRRTAELLATTPAGGPGMIWRKGAAIGISQALAIILCAVLVTRATSTGRYDHRAVARVAGLLAGMAFFWAAGISFSIVVKSPITAPVMLLMTAVATLAAGQWMVERYGGYGRWHFGSTILVVLFGIGALAVAVRQYFGRLAPVVLLVGLSVALAGGCVLVLDSGGPREDILEAFVYPLRQRHFESGEAFRFAAVEAGLTALLLLGAFPRFTRHYLRGARPKD